MKRLMLSAILAIAATGAQAATVTNGSFEDGFSNTNAPWETVNPGQTNLDGWTVVHRNIDHVRDQRSGDRGYWHASDGDYSIDLNGYSQGGISQEISGLVVGQSYLLTFDLAGNPGGDQRWKIKEMMASIGGVSETFTFDTRGTSLTAMGWVQQALRFTATSETTTLLFRGVNPGNSGAALDNVALSAVPLPASALLMLGGLGGLAATRRRRKNG